MMILPPNAVSKEDVKKLNNNGICTVVAKNPASLQFVDPIPSLSSQTQMENASIMLSRKLLSGHGYVYDNFGKIGRLDIIRLYVELLIEGTSLDVRGTKEEQRQKLFEDEKDNELRRLARVEARKQHQEKLKAKQQEKQPNEP